MKNLVKILVVICIVFVGCTNKKQKESQKIEETGEIALEGMWKLKSGIWDNEDGTFLRYPEDSITEGPAYIIYSKKHYMVIAQAPKMNYYRGELVKYSINGNQLTSTQVLSNFEKHVGMEAVWTFHINEDVLTAENGKNKEVWERIE
jgi:hypothetical protein